MQLLLDTHILLWALYKPGRLSRSALVLLEDPTMTVVYSTASLWEVQIKHAKNPASMPPSAEGLHGDCEEAGLPRLPIRPQHIFGIDSLHQLSGSRAHRDPFDRLLLSQAKVEGCLFATHDDMLATYGESFVRLV